MRRRRILLAFAFLVLPIFAPSAAAHDGDHAGGGNGLQGYGMPTIVGVPKVGNVLSVKSWTSDDRSRSYGYQWNRCNSSGASCLAISAATASSYIPTTVD